MFIKVYVVNFSDYDNQFYKRRFQLPPGELAEYREHWCAPTEEDATQGLRLVCIVLYKDGAWEFWVSELEMLAGLNYCFMVMFQIVLRDTILTSKFAA